MYLYLRAYGRGTKARGKESERLLMDCSGQFLDDRSPFPTVVHIFTHKLFGRDALGHSSALRAPKPNFYTDDTLLIVCFLPMG